MQTNHVIFSKEYGGKSFNPTKILNNAVANIICSLLFGGRYEYEDEIFQDLQKAIGSLFEHMQNAIPVRLLNLLVGFQVYRSNIFKFRNMFDRKFLCGTCDVKDGYLVYKYYKVSKIID